MINHTTQELLDLLAAHRRHLAVLQIQVAKLGSTHAQPGQLIEIDEARTAIADLTAALLARGVAVEEPPEAPPSPPASAASGGIQIGQAEVAGVVSLPGANFAGAQGIQITGVQVGQRAQQPAAPPERSES